MEWNGELHLHWMNFVLNGYFVGEIMAPKIDKENERTWNFNSMHTHAKKEHQGI